MIGLAKAIEKSCKIQWKQAWKLLTNDLGRSFRYVGLSGVWGCGGASPKPLGSRGAEHTLRTVRDQAAPGFTSYPLQWPGRTSSSITTEALQTDSTWPKRVTHLFHQGKRGPWLPSLRRHWKARARARVCRCWHRYSTSKHLWNLLICDLQTQ